MVKEEVEVEEDEVENRWMSRCKRRRRRGGVREGVGRTSLMKDPA